MTNILWFNLSSAKKVIISATMVSDITTPYGGERDGLFSISNNNVRLSLTWDLQTRFTWTRVAYGNTNWNVVWDVQWPWITYYPVVTLDFESKISTLSCNNFNDSTLTLSDADLSNIRTFDRLSVYVTQHTFYIQDISIEVL